MYIIAHITDKANAPAIRRQLRKTGFRYQPQFKEWINPVMTLRGARLALPRVKSITGIKYNLRPQPEMCDTIDAAVAEATEKRSA